jgi:hypothetical protein
MQLYLFIFTLWRSWSTSVYYVVVAETKEEGKKLLDDIYPMVKEFGLDEFVVYKTKIENMWFKGVIKELYH